MEGGGVVIRVFQWKGVGLSRVFQWKGVRLSLEYSSGRGWGCR